MDAFGHGFEKSSQRAERSPSPAESNERPSISIEAIQEVEKRLAQIGADVPKMRVEPLTGEPYQGTDVEAYAKEEAAGFAEDGYGLDDVSFSEDGGLEGDAILPESQGKIRFRKSVQALLLIATATVALGKAAQANEYQIDDMNAGPAVMDTFDDLNDAHSTEAGDVDGLNKAFTFDPQNLDAGGGVKMSPDHLNKIAEDTDHLDNTPSPDYLNQLGGNDSVPLDQLQDKPKQNQAPDFEELNQLNSELDTSDEVSAGNNGNNLENVNNRNEQLSETTPDVASEGADAEPTESTEATPESPFKSEDYPDSPLPGEKTFADRHGPKAVSGLETLEEDEPYTITSFGALDKGLDLSLNPDSVSLDQEPSAHFSEMSTPDNIGSFTAKNLVETADTLTDIAMHGVGLGEKLGELSDPSDINAVIEQAQKDGTIKGLLISMALQHAHSEMSGFLQNALEKAAFDEGMIQEGEKIDRILENAFLKGEQYFGPNGAITVEYGGGFEQPVTDDAIGDRKFGYNVGVRVTIALN